MLAPIDSVLDLSGERLFIKIDVEGWEAKALRGMSRILSLCQAFLQVESAPEKLNEVKAILAELGYSYLGNPMGHDHYFSNMDTTDTQPMRLSTQPPLASRQ